MKANIGPIKDKIPGIMMKALLEFANDMHNINKQVVKIIDDGEGNL